MSPTIDELVAQGAPISDDELRALATLDDLEAELCAAIMRAPRAAVAKTPPRRRAPWLAGRRLRVAGAVAAVVCAALVLAATSFLGTDPGTQRAWAAEAVRVANAVPRLLIDAPGWKVVRADEFSVDFGEMTFANGERRFDLKWNRTRPGDVLARARDNDPSARVVQTTQVLGHRARVYRYSTNGSGGYLTGVWTQAGYGLELRAASPASEASSVEELVALVHRLRAASVEDWLSAMPASVVLPADREKAVRAMLADIPVPAGFDVDRLTSGDSVRDRYQLGARVAEAAACAWIRRWVGARDRGDEAGKDQAFGALRSSRDWAILREMQVEGDYPEVLWARVDSIVVARAGAREPLDMQRAGADELGCGTLE